LNFQKKTRRNIILIGIYEALSNLLEKQEKFKESLAYYKKLIEAKEEYLSNETISVSGIWKQQRE
jgi:hypothetical protein